MDIYCIYLSLSSWSSSSSSVDTVAHRSTAISLCQSSPFPWFVVHPPSSSHPPTFHHHFHQPPFCQCPFYFVWWGFPSSHPASLLEPKGGHPSIISSSPGDLCPLANISGLLFCPRQYFRVNFLSPGHNLSIMGFVKHFLDWDSEILTSIICWLP